MRFLWSQTCFALSPLISTTLDKLCAASALVIGNLGIGVSNTHVWNLLSVFVFTRACLFSSTPGSMSLASQLWTLFNMQLRVCAPQGRHSREINLGQLMREEYGQRVRRPMWFGRQPCGSPMTGLPHAVCQSIRSTCGYGEA